jgi:hypothetical protein
MQRKSQITDHRSPITDHDFFVVHFGAGGPLFSAVLQSDTSRSRPERHESLRASDLLTPPLRRLARSGACSAPRPSRPATQTRTGSRNAPLVGPFDAAETPPTAPWQRRSAPAHPRRLGRRCGVWVAPDGAGKAAWQSCRARIEQRRPGGALSAGKVPLVEGAGLGRFGNIAKRGRCAV